MFGFETQRVVISYSLYSRFLTFTIRMNGAVLSFDTPVFDLRKIINLMESV